MPDQQWYNPADAQIGGTPVATSTPTSVVSKKQVLPTPVPTSAPTPTSDQQWYNPADAQIGSTQSPPTPLDVIGGFWDGLKTAPIAHIPTMLGQAAHMIAHPEETWEQVQQNSGQAENNAIAAWKRGEYGPAYIHEALSMLPLLGPAVDQPYEELKEAQASGDTVAEAQAYGKLVGLAGSGYLARKALPAAVQVLKNPPPTLETAGAVLKGIAKAPKEVVTSFVKYRGMEMPAALMSAWAGGQVAEDLGLPKAAGAVVGGVGIPLIKGLYTGIKGELGDLAIRRAEKAQAAARAQFAANSARAAAQAQAQAGVPGGVPQTPEEVTTQPTQTPITTEESLGLDAPVTTTLAQVLKVSPDEVSDLWKSMTPEQKKTIAQSYRSWNGSGLKNPAASAAAATEATPETPRTRADITNDIINLRQAKDETPEQFADRSDALMREFRGLIEPTPTPAPPAPSTPPSEPPPSEPPPSEPPPPNTYFTPSALPNEPTPSEPTPSEPPAPAAEPEAALAEPAPASPSAAPAPAPAPAAPAPAVPKGPDYSAGEAIHPDYAKMVADIQESGTLSIPALSKKYGPGYNWINKNIVPQLEKDGIIGPAGSGPREVLNPNPPTPAAPPAPKPAPAPAAAPSNPAIPATVHGDLMGIARQLGLVKGTGDAADYSALNAEFGGRSLKTVSPEEKFAKLQELQGRLVAQKKSTINEGSPNVSEVPSGGGNSSAAQSSDQSVPRGEPAAGSDVASAPPAPNQTRIIDPNGGAAFPATYEIRDAFTGVKPSHNFDTWKPTQDYPYTNERAYDDPNNRNKVYANALPGKFEPSIVLGDTPTATDGPPGWDENGNTLFGNGRAMTLQRVYKYNPEGAAAYRQALMQKAAQFGIDPEVIRNTPFPELGRRIPKEALANGGAERLIADSNVSGTALLTPAEQAIKDSTRVSPAVLKDIAGRLEPEDATLASVLRGSQGTEILDKLIADNVIKPGERAGLANAKGLTPDGKSRIQQLLLGRFFRNVPQLDNVSPLVSAKLEKLTGIVSGLTKTGAYDPLPIMQQALDLLEEARTRKMTIESVAAQPTIEGYQYPKWALDMAKQLKNAKQNILVDSFRRYAQDAVHYSSDQALLGGQASTPEQAEQSFNDAVAYAKEQDKVRLKAIQEAKAKKAQANN